MTFYIQKSSGEKQRFDLPKFRRSLFKAGAKEKEINHIIQQIKKDHPKSTQKIHEIATKFLQEKNPAVADRYNLKRAIMELGPDGYPFEKFIGQLFVAQGFEIETNVIIPGACVEHEVDVTAREKKNHFMIECKFHNRVGLKSNVKVSLYVQARFEDIRDAWQASPQHEHEFHQAWIVTNTKFTSEATKYAECKNMKLMSWAYPEHQSLAALVEKHDLFPITTLTSLTKHQKRTFLRNGLVLCRDARKHQKMLQKLGLKPREITRIVSESEAICQLKRSSKPRR